jgi:ketosteroid isomerase-like protein
VDDREQVMREFLDGFNNHDVDAIMGFFTEDCEFDTPRGPTPFGRQMRGKEQVREGIASRGSRMSATTTTCTGIPGTEAFRSGRCAARLPMDNTSRSGAATYSSSMATRSNAKIRSGR